MPPVTDCQDYTSGPMQIRQSCFRAIYAGNVESFDRTGAGRSSGWRPGGVPVCYSFSHQTFSHPRCFSMSRMVRCGLIQARNVLGAEHSLGEIRDAMVRKHVHMIGHAAQQQVQILCLQELFYGPYFCAEQAPRWYELAEAVPDGP